MREYDRAQEAGDEMQDKLNIAALSGGMPVKIKDHLRANAVQINTYSFARDTVRAHVNAQKQW
eukprot:10302113-Lingulodinium_polyedra.AAC.1